MGEIKPEIQGIASIFIFAFCASSAVAQDDLCSRPLESGIPKVTLISPDLSALAAEGEKIRNFNSVVVHGQNDNDQHGTILNAAPDLHSKTTTTVGGLGRILQENGENYLNVTVTLSGEFSPVGT